MTIPEAFNFQQWIQDNQDRLKPPVNNQVLHPEDSDLIIQVVGGPNLRTDFHNEPYPEWFYQLKGDMHVKVIEDGELRRVDINEGDVWMLPPNTSHSPQRPDPDSLGIVVEKVREDGKLEKFQWFCPQCSNKVHEVELQVRDIVKDLPPVFEQFYASSEQARTCSQCGALHPGKG